MLQISIHSLECSRYLLSPLLPIFDSLAARVSTGMKEQQGGDGWLNTAACCLIPHAALGQVRPSQATYKPFVGRIQPMGHRLPAQATPFPMCLSKIPLPRPGLWQTSRLRTLRINRTSYASNKPSVYPSMPRTGGTLKKSFRSLNELT